MLAAEGDGIDEVGACVVEQHILAVAAQRKAGVQARRGAVRVAPNDEIRAGLERGVGGENEPTGIAVVGQAPAIQRHGRRAAVAQLYPIGKLAAVGDRRDVVGHDFVEHHLRCRQRRGQQAGRTIERGAEPPVGRRIRIAGEIDHLQRVTAAVGASRPAVAVAVGHRDDGMTGGILHRETFAAVVERAAEPTENRSARIARLEGVGVRRRRQHEDATRRDRGAELEHKADAFHVATAEVDRRTARVVEFEELVGVTAGRVVVDLGEAQRHAEFGNREGSFRASKVTYTGISVVYCPVLKI